jgi:hypothetical protein
MMRPFKLRRQDTFRDERKTKLPTLLRAWLNWIDAGICRSRRSQKPRDNAHGHKQATESVEDGPHLESASIATNKPGNVDLYLLLKKRTAQSLSEQPDEPETGRNRSAEGSEKAVQE